MHYRKRVPSSTDKSSSPERFRRCVACLLIDAQGRLLICERVDFADSWQFPQGGQDYGETTRQTLARELMEEISIPPASYTILTEKKGYRYRFPVRHRRRGKYVGQQQTYFLCKFHGPDTLINLQTAHPEFRSYQWIHPSSFKLDWLPDFKRGVYAAVLEDFFNLHFPAEDLTGVRATPKKPKP